MAIISFIDIPEVFNIRIVQGENVKHDFKEHVHSTFILGIITSGHILMKVRDKTYEIKSKQGYFLPPQTPHTIICNDSEYSHLVLCINAECIKNSINIKSFADFTIDNEIYNNIKTFVSLIFKKNISSDEKKNALKEIFAKLQDKKECNEQTKEFEQYKFIIGKSIQCTEENDLNNLSLDYLSNKVNMSKFHYSRLFKKIVGLSPYDYFLQCKIKQAQIFLENNYSIVNAANKAGFYDQSHFTKYFKKFVGIRPNEYKENHKKI